MTLNPLEFRRMAGPILSSHPLIEAPGRTGGAAPIRPPRERVAEALADGSAPRRRDRTWSLGPLTFLETRQDCGAPTDARLHIRRDRNGDWLLETSATPVEPGTEARRATTASLQCCTLGGGAPLAEAEAPGWRRLALIIPDAWRPGLTASLTRRDQSPLTGPAAELLAIVMRETPERLRKMDLREQAAVADMIAGLLRASLLRDGAEARAPEVAGPARERVSRTISENIGSARLDARRICALTGLSRSTLYRLFEGESGVAAHVRAIRLRLVMDDLLDPAMRGDPISAIAERRGFHCAASFNRTFRRAYGRTPSEARAEALSGRRQGLALDDD
jgi:AraC-like DNA-binding protein